MIVIVRQPFPADPRGRVLERVFRVSIKAPVYAPRFAGEVAREFRAVTGDWRSVENRKTILLGSSVCTGEPERVRHTVFRPQ